VRTDLSTIGSISAFFPCYNDESSIAEMVERVTGAFDVLGVDGDVTVVNDASPDGAAAVLDELAQTEPRLRIVTHEHNRGYGGALQSGFAAATGEWVFYTDGDGQYDPAELVDLVARVDDDVDVVQGYKLARSDNFARKLIGRLYHHLVAVLFGLQIRDTDCDFRLIRRSKLNEFALESTSGVICVELVWKLEHAGARFVQVGVDHYPRMSGRSAFFKPRNVAKTLLDLAILWFHLVVLHQGRGTAKRSAPRRHAWTTVFAALALFAVTFATALRAPVNHADEAWFLWVALRANHGARLYHDVYYVSTPLAMWFMQGAVWLFGPHLAAERALASGLFTTSVLLVWSIGVRLSVRRVVRAVLVVGLFVFASPVAHFASVYSMLAVTLTLGAALVAVVWAEHAPGPRRTRLACVGGILCGLAFASKPTTGLLAIAAFATVAVVGRVRERPDTHRNSDLVGVFGGFAATVGAIAVPFVATGTLSDLVGNVFTGKSDYVSVVANQVFPGFSRVFDPLVGKGGSLASQIVAANEFVALAAVVLLVVAVWKATDRCDLQLVALAAFTVVGIGAAAPDFGAQHTTEAIPLLLALPVFALALIPAPVFSPPRLPRLVALTVASSLALVGLVAVAADAQTPTVTNGDQVVASDLPHLDGVMISAVHEAQVVRDAALLRRRTGGRVFIVESNASLLYLTGNLTNPTPYDFPARSDFGAGGETGAISYLRHHHVHWLCVPRDRHRSLGAAPTDPQALDRYIRHQMHFAARFHACDLYRNEGPRHSRVAPKALSRARPPRLIRGEERRSSAK
jgi:hypothetical protein